MIVKTSSGFVYSYNPIDNSIVDGEVVDMGNIHTTFKPLDAISELPNVSSFTIGVTEQCNFRCSYCCYSGQYREHRKHSPRKLSINDINPIVDFMVKHSCQDVITIDFYGGESLLEFDWIKALVQRTGSIDNKSWKFEISTNGLLLRREIVDWFVQNEFKIFVSVDGVDDYHDSCRKDVHGHNTYSRIYANLTYMRDHYPNFWDSKVNVMMTIQDIALLPSIAEGWVADPLFRDKIPYRISEVSTIYNENTQKASEAIEMDKYLHLVYWFRQHPGNHVMQCFFNIWLAEWIDRPIVELNQETEYPTCVPHNRKLYIDASMNIGLCERITDTIRIGSVKDGIDYSNVNKVAESTATFIEQNCSKCEIARICDLCPDILKISDDILDTYCHNQKVLQKIKFRCFCELAEGEMV